MEMAKDHDDLPNWHDFGADPLVLAQPFLQLHDSLLNKDV